MASEVFTEDDCTGYRKLFDVHGTAECVTLALTCIKSRCGENSRRMQHR